MAYPYRNAAWNEQLWNLSLLPIVQVSHVVPPPPEPEPGGSVAPRTAAVLSESENAPLSPLAKAA